MVRDTDLEKEKEVKKNTGGGKKEVGTKLPLQTHTLSSRQVNKSQSRIEQLQIHLPVTNKTLMILRIRTKDTFATTRYKNWMEHNFLNLKDRSHRRYELQSHL